MRNTLAPAVADPGYTVEVTTLLVGEGVLSGAALVVDTAAPTPTVTANVPILACPRLWDDQGVRMALKDQRHSNQAIATLPAKLVLHAAPLPAAAGHIDPGFTPN